ncbi:MAG TPA: hydroxymethylbilane synthase [Candidatus Dormibacteraeota bacterium]|nr:hydroxymethylbilane synthase [Candidatus Dormibacteraeota bacterium]
MATRGSKLALAQSRLAVEALQRRHPQHEFVLEALQTRGDREQSLPLTDAPQEGVFVKELEAAVLEGRAELAVHSLKDLPTTETGRLVVAAYLPRGDARDVLISREGSTLESLPSGARVGTGSPRRVAQLLARRPDLRAVPIRGNVDTRLRKLADGGVDAVVLAAAGVERLGRAAEVTQPLPFDVMLPAPGQGALAVQALAGTDAAKVAAAVDDLATRRAAEAERNVLRGLGGGCLSAVGAYARVEGRELSLQVVVLAEDGKQVIRAAARGEDSTVVSEAIRSLLAQGSSRLLRGEPGTDEALHGLRVMVTRGDSQAEGLSRMLQERGAEVVRCPTIVIEPLPVDLSRYQPLDRYGWIVFTSANGVERFLELLRAAATPFPAGARTAAIGPETAARLRQRGIEPALVPERFVAEELAEALPAALLRGQPVLLPRAAGARDVLPQRLRAQGAQVDVIETYRAQMPPGLADRLPLALEGVDVVTLTSSSTARTFAAALGAVVSASPRWQTACIGPITAATAGELGLRVDIIATEYTARGLVDALVRHRLSIRA